MQKKVIDLLKYSLNPRGFLFLGNSENITETNSTFSVINRKHRLFQNRKDSYNKFSALLNLPSANETAPGSLWQNQKMDFPSISPLRELTEQSILQQENMVAALLNKQGDILYLHGHSRKYLEITPGVTEMNNILKMARPELKSELNLALQRAIENNETVTGYGLQVKTNGSYTSLNFSVRPVELNTSDIYGSPLF